MLFHSIDFFLIFPIVIIGHFFIPNNRLRIFFLLIISYVFYMWNSPLNAIYLVFSTLVTYFIGIRIHFSKHKKSLLTIGLILNLGLLFFFKAYEPFFPFLKDIFPKLPYKSFSIPLGLSFYTFQAVSYIFDIYRKRIEPETNFFDFSLFHSFFPQLMAGPIEKTKNLLPQLKVPQSINYQNFRRGALIFSFGLVKKLVVADRLAALSGPIVDSLHYNTIYATILGGYPVAFQYYFDFSAYSDIALGVALIMGIKLTRNFDSPFLAASPIDFWRRWHISFMNWLHDYVFMPIIELDFSFYNVVAATLVVFLISGAWHGVGLRYIIWGFLNGTFVVLNILYRKFIRTKENKFLKPFKIIGTFHLFVISGFFLFQNEPFGIIKTILTDFHLESYNLNPLFTKTPHFDSAIVFLAVPILMLGEIIFSKLNFWEMFDKTPTLIRWSCYTAIMVILILFSYTMARPYVYFKF